jgi:arylsulfatase A-like enzyme
LVSHYFFGIPAGTASRALKDRYPSRVSRPQNILFLWTDQHRADAMGAYGNPRIRTPHLDRLASTGTLFSQAYCAQPVCSPSRASVLSGVYPHTHGVTANSMTLPSQTTTIAERLRPEGYACGYVGKWHLGREHCAQRGFEDFWSSTENYGGGYRPGDPDPKGLSDYEQSLVARGYLIGGPNGEFSPIGRPAAAALPEEAGKPAFQAVECIRFLEKFQDRPFLLMCNFLDPHPPNNSPFDSMYDPATIPLPDSWHGQLEESVPLRYRLRRQHTERLDVRWKKWAPSYLSGNTARAWQELIARYWGQVTLVDKYVGRILSQLDELGLSRNTIVVYSTDHADMMGEHRLLNKGLNYEGAARVPLLIRAPGLTPRRIETPVSQVSVVSTLLDLLNLPIPPHQHGDTLVPLMTSGDRSPDDAEVVIEWNGYDSYPIEFAQPAPLTGDDETDRLLRAVDLRTIRLGRWKLSVHASGEHELYDLSEDPGETHNALHDAGFAPIVVDLYRRLLAWQRRTGDTLELPDPTATVAGAPAAPPAAHVTHA